MDKRNSMGNPKNGALVSLEVIAKPHRTAAPGLSPSSAMLMQFVDLQEVTPKPASAGRSFAPPASCKTVGFATGSLASGQTADIF
jgi:hypothetical protein